MKFLYISILLALFCNLSGMFAHKDNAFLSPRECTKKTCHDLEKNSQKLSLRMKQKEALLGTIKRSHNNYLNNGGPTPYLIGTLLFSSIKPRVSMGFLGIGILSVTNAFVLRPARYIWHHYTLKTLQGKHTDLQKKIQQEC